MQLWLLFYFWNFILKCNEQVRTQMSRGVSGSLLSTAPQWATVYWSHCCQHLCTIIISTYLWWQFVSVCCSATQWTLWCQVFLSPVLAQRRGAGHYSAFRYFQKLQLRPGVSPDPSGELSEDVLIGTLLGVFLFVWTEVERDVCGVYNGGRMFHSICFSCWWFWTRKLFSSFRNMQVTN